MDTNQLKNLIRVGKVSSVNGKTCRARVTFPDKDDLVSDELAVLQIGANGTEGYWVPEVNTQVLCLFLPNASGNGLNAGFILGAYYSKAKPPPEENANVRAIHFPDGSLIKWDGGAITIKAASAIKIEVPRVDIN